MSEQDSFLLLALPDPCLLAVLQYCAAADQRSLFSAARAHSRLHQLAAAALRSITADLLRRQTVKSVLQYLRTHAQHVSSINLKGTEYHTVCLRELPPDLQLNSLQLEWFDLQLLPGTVKKPSGRLRTRQGVLGDADKLAALRQLRLRDCDLFLDYNYSEAVVNGPGLAALSKLPTGLEHLSISRTLYKGGDKPEFPTGVLARLQQLTYLELSDLDLTLVLGLNSEEDCRVQEEGAAQVHTLQPLQALTRLAVLRLHDLKLDMASDRPCRITASMLPSTHLKQLVFSGAVQLEPKALAGKTQLQHLDLDLIHTVTWGGAQVAQLLSYIRPLQELTHLRLGHLWTDEADGPPATAYSALTVSSKLQHLDISSCMVAEGVWEHLFPAGRQLPHLQSLNLSYLKESDGLSATAPEGSRLASTCASLQCLDLRGLQELNAERVAPLQGLTRLQTLQLSGVGLTATGWQAVGQMTGLRELAVGVTHRGITRELLLQSTQLKQLTSFSYRGCGYDGFDLVTQDPADKPVWCRISDAVQQLCMEDSVQEAAAQADAELGE